MKKYHYALLAFSLLLANCSKLDTNLLVGSWIEKSITIDGVAATLGLGSTVTYLPCNGSICSGSQVETNGKVYNFTYKVNDDETITITNISLISHSLKINELTTTKLNVTQEYNGQKYVADFVRK